MAQQLEMISGRVTAVNDKGVKLDGDDEWLNISKYAKPAPKLPAKGERVTLGMDTQGFIRTIESDSPSTGGNGHHASGSSASGETLVIGAPLDPVHVRLECLKEAIRFASGRTDVNALKITQGASMWAEFVITGRVPTVHEEPKAKAPPLRKAEPKPGTEDEPPSEPPEYEN